MHRFFSTLVIVVSINTYTKPDWQGVVEALRLKHSDMEVATVIAAPEITSCKPAIMEHPHRYVAFVMEPDEVRFKTVFELSQMMRELDDDIYEDAIWGIVTGPDAFAAMRMVQSDEPKNIDCCLATTGVSEKIVPGPVVGFRDSNPAGCWFIKDESGERVDFQRDGDLGQYFADAWEIYDPQLLITASHASQFNLELPFSRGNLVPFGGRFGMCPDITLIDYKTGQAKEGVGNTEVSVPLSEPEREKIWIAAGNCLIADNYGDDNMIMTALGWGKCNQFMGYMATTWFGFTGWSTLEQFSRYRKPLNEAHFAAKQCLLKELSETVENSRDFRPAVEHAAEYDRIFTEAQKFEFTAKKPIADLRRFVGLLWDRDATVLYGDPVKNYALKPRERPLKAWENGMQAQIIVFPDRIPGRRLIDAPPGFEVQVEDDFAFVTKWPKLENGWQGSLVFE